MFKKVLSILSISYVFLFVLLLGTIVIAQSEDDATLILGPSGAVLREAPAKEGDMISWVDGRIPILGTNPDEKYYFVEVEGQQGWISIGYGRVEGDLSTLPVVEPDTLPDRVADEPILVLGASGGALRQSPSKDADRIAQVTNARIPIIGISLDEKYYLVDYEGQQGWINTFFRQVEGDLTSVPIVDPAEVDNLIPEVTEELEIEPCFVSTDQPRAVFVRVGFGINRGVSTSLATDTEFEVLGQNTADDATWYALDKEEAAPGKSINGDVVWVVAEDVEAIGNCNTLPIMEASGITLPPPETVDGSDDTIGSDISTGVTVIVPADAGWVDSGFAVSQGQTIIIRASGNANLFSNCWTDCPGDCDKERYCPGAISHGPQGYFSTVLEGFGGDVEQASLFAMPTGQFGALIGRIGNGAVFEVGRGGTFTANANGTLLFIHNDGPALENNSGSFTVVITVE
jgi:hypothetical protein